MNIAVLSDTRLPTSADYPGHGLGRIMLAIADGLQARGHNVVLFAGRGSKFDGKLITKADESEFLTARFEGYDAVLDGGHFHELGKMYPDYPIINLSHDREAKPGKNAVFPSKAHRAWYGYTETNGRVVYNGVPTQTAINTSTDSYFAFLGTFHAPKAPIMALEAARLAGVRLVMAGTTPPAPPPGAQYIGPVWGNDKLDFLARARALVYPSATECAPVTVLEAQSVGTPVIVNTLGGSKENMLPDVTGYVCRDTLEMVDAIGRIDAIARDDCRDFISKFRSIDQMIDGHEALLKQVANGERW